MNPYTVDRVQDGNVTYFFIRCMEDMSIMPLPTKYLTHMTRAKKSPNTVKRIAFSISYYMSGIYNITSFDLSHLKCFSYTDK